MNPFTRSALTAALLATVTTVLILRFVPPVRRFALNS